MWLLVPTVLALSLALPPFALSLGRGVPSLPPLACAGRRSPPQLTLDGETGVVTSVHTGSELHELNGRPLVQLTHDEWRALLERGMVAGGAMAAVSELARAALAASGSDVASHFEAASHEAASGDTLEVDWASDPLGLGSALPMPLRPSKGDQSAHGARSRRSGESEGSSESSSSSSGGSSGRSAPPLAELFAAAIGACADAGEWRTALALLRELEGAGARADVVLYTEAARACRAGGEWARTISLLNRARECGHSSSVGLYSQVIGALDDANQPAKMVEIYALGVEDKVFSHWHAGEPFSLDLHKFSQATAVSAVRYVLQHELGNYLPADLKIITGWGQHTPEGATPTLLPRIERLLSAELSPPLPYEKQTRLDCDRSGCRVVDNDGCLVVPVQELFKWLVDSRPFETYCINVPRST